MKTYYSSNKQGGNMKVFLGILLLIPFLLWGGLRIYKSVVYNIDCGGYLKRAADANTIELASKELDVVLQYLEQTNKTNGYTSVFYQTPDEDVGFWFTNLKTSRAELGQVTSTTSQLEKSNLLIKLRETLLDSGKEGMIVTEPSGISVFPNNGGWMVFGIISVLCICAGGVLISIKLFEF